MISYPAAAEIGETPFSSPALRAGIRAEISEPAAF